MIHGFISQPQSLYVITVEYFRGWFNMDVRVLCHQGIHDNKAGSNQHDEECKQIIFCDRSRKIANDNSDPTNGAMA